MKFDLYKTRLLLWILAYDFGNVQITCKWIYLVEKKFEFNFFDLPLSP